MRIRVVIAVLAIAAVVAAMVVAFALRDALHQMSAFGVSGFAASAAIAPVVPPVVWSASSSPSAAGSEPAPDDARGSEPAASFDSEGALREARDRDESVAEFLDDPDPAIGAAVRAFLTELEAPGSR